jgi:hypothetical protein
MVFGVRHPRDLSPEALAKGEGRDPAKPRLAAKKILSLRY